MDVVCCDIRVVSSRKRRGERVGVGSRGKYPGAPPHHKGKRNQADRKRYLIGLLGEKGKAKQKKNNNMYHHLWYKGIEVLGSFYFISFTISAVSKIRIDGRPIPLFLSTLPFHEIFDN
jgi:hypothetical protein